MKINTASSNITLVGGEQEKVVKRATLASLAPPHKSISVTQWTNVRVNGVSSS